MLIIIYHRKLFALKVETDSGNFPWTGTERISLCFFSLNFPSREHLFLSDNKEICSIRLLSAENFPE